MCRCRRCCCCELTIYHYLDVIHDVLNHLHVILLIPPTTVTIQVTDDDQHHPDVDIDMI